MEWQRALLRTRVVRDRRWPCLPPRSTRHSAPTALGGNPARRNILIQPEEVPGIVVRLDGDHAFPSLVIRLGHAGLLVAAHEVHIDARFHRRAKPFEDRASPGDV